MALTLSQALNPGTTAPPLNLPDTRNGQMISLEAYRGQPVIIVFMCNHCPYVIHILDELLVLAAQVAERGVQTVAISANDPTSYPQDGPDKMKALATARGFPFPYCFDETQDVARAYGAQCTPEFLVFDTSHRLYYHGQFDETRPGGEKAHGSDLRRAIEQLLRGLPPQANASPSVGCSIKWRH